MNIDDKMKLMDEILKASPIKKKVNKFQYRIRCPICGDSQKDLTDSHCYLKCTDDPSEPILYNCFLRNCHGKVDGYFLKKLGASKYAISIAENQKYNRIPSIKKSNIEIITGDPIMNSPQIKYINKRLGSGFTYEDFDKFKIIWDMDNLKTFITDQKVLNTMPNNTNSISFLSDDKSAIFTRTFESSEFDHQWRKIKIIRNDQGSHYIIKSMIDLFSKNDIYVNIAEGIFDILSVYKNFNDGPNSVFIAALGSDYIGTLNFAILKGFIGNNIIVKLYIDQGIDEKDLYYKLKRYKWLFKQIYVYKNINGKDVGERMETIKLQEKRI